MTDRPDESKTAVLLSPDLMFTSRAGGAAQRAEVSLIVVSDAAALVEHCANAPTRLAIIDLATPALDVTGLIAQLRTADHPPGAIVAYGPHVQAGRLATAGEAGCDLVLTRGQFDSQMENVLRRFAGEPGQ